MMGRCKAYLQVQVMAAIVFGGRGWTKSSGVNAKHGEEDPSSVTNNVHQ